ncbi:MAG: 50S ribosomal protein L7Ae-like protein [Candidatus Cloacimonetes bacterium HGW-Cloacimonetes-3]|jgi:ribosomal protein L7Ae-like RNA K-turn-binding protein|nr:MAG: 50S ribosomal protein L7Ae-like protein [Candidatus Cloacimonetes bacterium HGW-Cloacimonetes-3]
MDARILNLMQFARKAGKMVSGLDACVRGLNHHVIRLLIVAEDTSIRTQNNLLKTNSSSPNPVKIILTGSQKEISYALGLPITGVFGVSDKNFAAKILEYWKAEA